MTDKTPRETAQEIINAHFPPAVYANMTERQKECVLTCVAATLLTGISQIASNPENTELVRTMAKEAAEFEKTLDSSVNIKYMPSTVYPWGWCYIDGEVRRKFREFCTRAK